MWQRPKSFRSTSQIIPTLLGQIGQPTTQQSSPPSPMRSGTRSLLQINNVSKSSCPRCPLVEPRPSGPTAVASTSVSQPAIAASGVTVAGRRAHAAGLRGACVPASERRTVRITTSLLTQDRPELLSIFFLHNRDVSTACSHRILHLHRMKKRVCRIVCQNNDWNSDFVNFQ